MRLFVPRRATPHRLRALFARSSVVARVRFLPLTGMGPLPTFQPLLRLRSRVFSLPRFNRPRRPSRRLNPSKHKTLHRTISLRVGRRAALTNRARRAEALPEDSDGAASGSGGAATASGLTAAEENEFHAFLVDRFNQCVQLSGSLRESSGHLQYDADLGDFGDAAQWYSDMLIYDNSIDSMKVELNRKIPVAERSRYRNFWSEIQYMVNDLGTMSAALVNQWGIAKQSGSASAVDTSATYASYRAHEDRARSLA